MSISVTQADASWEITPVEPVLSVTAGETTDYPVMAVFSRPIRPKLPKLLQKGFVEDKSQFNITSISQVVITQADASWEEPNGAFGVWGVAQKYDKSKLDGVISFSYDGFETVSASSSLDIEYKAGSGIDPAVVKGENDAKAGTGVRTYCVRLQPKLGLPYQECNLPGGFSEKNIQMGRLVVRVKDVRGDPVANDAVRYEATGDFYLTDTSGKVVLDAPAGSLSFTGLRGAVSKTTDLNAFELKELEFQYGGIEGVVEDANGNTVPKTVVKIEEKGGGESFIVYTDGKGKYSFAVLKPLTTYTVTILNYWKDFTVFGEGVLLTGNFSNAEGWNPPEGYPTPPQSAFIVIKDEKGNPVFDIPVEIYDDKLSFVSRTNLNGNAVLVVPPTKWNLLIDGGNRYNSVSKEIDLSTAPYTEEVILRKKIAISIR